MNTVATIFFLLTFLVGYAAHDTPVQKVIQLLSDLVVRIEGEGHEEANTYNTFACFCQDTTNVKSGLITDARDAINVLSAGIEQDTAKLASQRADLQAQMQHKEQTAQSLLQRTKQCNKAEQEFNLEDEDLSKANSALDAAIEALERGHAGGAVLMELRKSTLVSVALAEKMGKEASEGKRFLERQSVDPSDPEYKVNEKILNLLKDLQTEFKANHKKVRDDWSVTSLECTNDKSNMQKAIGTADDSIALLNLNIKGFETDIAQHRIDLQNANGQLASDTSYLEELTKRCESRANVFDQRSKMRHDELEALKGALAIIEGKVLDADTKANKRAVDEVEASPPTFTQVAKVVPAAASLLQERRVQMHSVQSAASSSVQQEADPVKGKQQRAAAVLSQSGSKMLANLASRVGADPFEKIKGLIEALIDRLQAEHFAEITKKGFCDTQMTKNKNNVERYHGEVMSLLNEVNTLQVKKSELEIVVKDSDESRKASIKFLEQEQKDRDAEKKQNLETIATAKQGLEAVTEALAILKEFYKQGAKAFVQESPVNADDPGAADTTYQGAQESSKGVIGMVEVIKTDFERTIRVTTEAEENARAEFVDLDQKTRADISEKKTTFELSTADLKETNDDIKAKMDKLQQTQDTLDIAMQEQETLVPVCVDTGMSYEERKKKREQEVEALKKALCILDPNQVEADCQVI